MDRPTFIGRSFFHFHFSFKMLLTILGPTACGKTAVATRLAALFATQKEGMFGSSPAEIISADSRQVFRGMDVGTGKDLADYEVTAQLGNKEVLLHIPYHLIDIAEAGTKYSVFHFQRDFLRAYIIYVRAQESLFSAAVLGYTLRVYSGDISS